MKYIQNNKLLEVPEGYKKMVLQLDAGIIGTSSYEAYLVPVSMSEKDLEDWAWQAAVDHGSMYGMYNKGDYWEMTEEQLEEDGINLDDECYTEDLYGEFVEYNAEKHDNLLIFGANKDFQWNQI